MFKNVLLSISLLASIGLQAETIKITRAGFFAPASLGALSLYHNGRNFEVEQNGVVKTVQNCWKDKLLQKMDQETLKKFLNHGYVSVDKMSDGEFSLKSNVRGLGGGPIGASIGFWVGKVATYTVCYGAIGIASAFTGPAAGVTFATMSASLSPFIEGASQVVSLGTGIAGGVATGPV